MSQVFFLAKFQEENRAELGRVNSRSLKSIGQLSTQLDSLPPSWTYKAFINLLARFIHCILYQPSVSC